MPTVFSRIDLHDFYSSIIRFQQKRYRHALWHQPRFLYDHGLSYINPHCLRPFIETAISRNIRSQQDWEMYHFFDYQRRGLPLSDPSCTPFNSPFAFYHLSYGKLHSKEFQENIQLLKDLSDIIYSVDINYLLKGEEKISSNSGSLTSSKERPFKIEKLKTKNRSIDQNWEEYHTYIREKIEFLSQKQYARFSLDKKKRNGSSKKLDKVRKGYQQKVRKSKSQVIGLIWNHLFCLLLKGQLHYDDGRLVTLDNCGYIGSLIFQGEGESEQLLYLLFVTNFKYVSSNQQFDTLLTYFQEKFYDDNIGASPKDKVIFRKKLQEEQAFWRKVLKEHPILPELKLRFLNLIISELSQDELNLIKEKDPLQNLNQRVFQREIQEITEARKKIVLAEKIEQEKQFTSEEEEYLTKSKSLINLMPALKPWDQIQKLKDQNPVAKKRKSINLLSRLNNILFCITEDIAGKCELKEDEWKITERFSPHPKLHRKLNHQEQDERQEDDWMVDESNAYEEKRENLGSNQFNPENIDSDNELEFEPISLKLSPFPFNKPQKDFLYDQEWLKSFEQIEKQQIQHEKSKISNEDLSNYICGTLHRKRSKRFGYLIDSSSVVQTLQIQEIGQFEKKNYLKSYEDFSSLFDYFDQQHQKKQKGKQNEASKVKNQKQKKMQCIEFQDFNEPKGRKKVKIQEHGDRRNVKKTEQKQKKNQMVDDLDLLFDFD